MIWDDGDRFKGFWINGLREGKGVYYWKDDRKFEGYWEKDILVGKGYYYYANGNYEYMDSKLILDIK